MVTESAELYDAVYSFKDYGAESAIVFEIITGHKQSPGKSLLEVACGTGKHAEHFRKHYDLTLLDLDAKLLKIASERLPDAKTVQADMVEFDLGRQFDVITCLFSSIGYVASVERLNSTLKTFARHLAPGGIVVIEAWFYPEQYRPSGVYARFVDEPDLKVARMNTVHVEGRLSHLDFHYTVGTPQGITTFTEKHTLMLFTHEEYLEAFRAAGLTVEFNQRGFNGRTLYIGMKGVE